MRKLNKVIDHPLLFQVIPASTLPTNICLECLTKLNQFNEFFTATKESQEILRIVFAEKAEIPAEIERVALGDETQRPEEEFLLFQEIASETHFSNHENLEQHVPEDQELIKQKPLHVKSLSKKKKFDRFDCYICKEQLSGNLKLLQHFNKDHPSAEIRYSCFLCPTFVKKYRSYTRHIESHSEKRFTCDICDKSFSQKITLVQHLNCHSNVRSYKCDDCGLHFKQNSSLFKHRRQKHSNELPSCSECQKTFVNNETLLQHMRSKHNFEKSISCRECLKTFASRSALIYHTSLHQKHSDDESKSCKICNKKFKTSIIRSRHIKNFH